MESAQILIASSGLDEGSWRPVVDHLRKNRRSVLVYQADRVADGRTKFEMRFGPAGSFEVRYDGQVLNPEGITAAWFRRPNMFSGDLNDRALQNTLDAERRVLQYGLWSALRRELWVTDPMSLYHAEHKMVQLRTAVDAGFSVPETLVINNWEGFKLSGTRIVYKPSYGTLYDRDGMRLLYATPFDNAKEALPSNGIPFPGVWQNYMAKAREWRVTVIGDEVFPAAIYTDAGAKDDWRKHQLASDKVRFRRATLPDEAVHRCLIYMRQLNLRFGAFDLVEGPDGAITFLECNANGQFGWLKEELGLPLSAAMANLLMRISDERKSAAKSA